MTGRRIAALLALAVAALSCSPAATPAGAAGALCPQTAPASADAWQAMWGKLPYVGDGNFSAGMIDGTSVWVTGDSAPRAGGAWASNTIVLVAGGCTRQLPNAVPDQATLQGTASWWPGPVSPLGNGFVSAGSWVLRTPGVGFGFLPLRSELGLFYANGHLAALVRVPASPAGVRWSAGVWAGPDGWLYVWGTTDGRPGQWGVDAYVARVDQRTLSAWRYWSGSTWTTNAAAVRPVLRAVDGNGTDTAFSVRLDAAGWHLYTRRGGAWGGEHGEYVGGPKVWTWRPGGTEPGYLPSAHPEAHLLSGRQLVTVNVAGVGARFVEVPR